PERLARIRRDLPVYIFSGSDDPVGANLPALAEAYRNAGLTRVEMKIYPGARHETLNETNRDEVTADLVRWSEGILTGA
ncbi:MAG: alpha/beta hydrolase, partial [Rhodoblastus sp.]